MALECKAGRTVRDSVIFAGSRNVIVPVPCRLISATNQIGISDLTKSTLFIRDETKSVSSRARDSNANTQQTRKQFLREQISIGISSRMWVGGLNGRGSRKPRPRKERGNQECRYSNSDGLNRGRGSAVDGQQFHIDGWIDQVDPNALW